MRRLGWRLRGLVVLAAAGFLTMTGQAGAVLPDGRAYELVSPPDTNGNSVYNTKASPDGERVAIAYQGGVPGSPSGGFSLLVSERTLTGWSVKSILPETRDLANTNYIPSLASPDLTRFIVAASIGAPTPKAVKLLRLDDDGSQTLLHEFDATLDTSLPVAASDDMSRVLASVEQQIDLGHAPGTRNVYDFGSGTPELVSKLPDGSIPLCGAHPSGQQSFYPAQGMPTEHRVSVDGKRAFFNSRGNTCSGQGIDLYMRDLETDTTTLISAPPLSGTNGGAVFLQATPDGSQVHYVTPSKLDPADADTTRDVYRYTVGSGNVCVTCVGLTNANVPNPSASERPIVTEDGSKVYFTTTNRLDNADDDSTKSIYLVEGTTLTYVAPADRIHPDSGSGGQATPDGNVVLFRSSKSQLNALTGSDNGGNNQYYRYERNSQTVTCISCPAGRPATASVADSLTGTTFGTDNPRAMSDDGSLIVFKTVDALVPEDTNADEDVYQWRDGQVGLITDGTTTYSQFFGSTLTGSQVVGVSADGEDVLFHSFSKLTADVLATGQPGSQLYDARVGGGFPIATPPADCGDGDACQAPPSPPPSLLGVGSSSFTGSGNLAPASSPSIAVARLTRRQLALFARTGRLVLRVRSGEAGRVSAIARARLGRRARVVARTSRSTGGDGRARLTLRLSRAARRALARHRRLRVVIVVRASDGSAAKRTVARLALPATGNRR